MIRLLRGTPSAAGRRPERPPFPPYMLLVLTTLFWSGNVVIGRAVVGTVPPVALSFWRWTVALAVLLLVGSRFAWKDRRAVLDAWRVITGLALLGVTLFNSILYAALNWTTAINAALVGSMSPVVIPAVAWVAYRSRLTGREALGLAVSLAGVVIVITRGDAAAIREAGFNVGDLMILLSVFLWALYSVLLMRSPARLHPLALLTATVAIGWVFIVPIYAWELWAGHAMTVNLGSVLAIAYAGVFPSVLAYLFWNRAVAAVGPSRAGLFIYLVPVFSSVLAIVFLGEALRAHHVFGTALIFAGIQVATRGRPSGTRSP